MAAAQQKDASPGMAAARNIDSIKAASSSPSPSLVCRTIGGQEVGVDAVEEAAAKLAAADLLDAPPINEAEATKALGSARMFERMSAKFGDQVAEGVGKIEAAFAEKDLDTLEMESNNLKGSSKFMAAKRLGAAATALQALTRPEKTLEVETGATDADALLAEIGAVVAELKAAATAVQSFLAGDAGGAGAAAKE